MTTPHLEYREIPLTRGEVTRVDLDDYLSLSRFRWQAWKSPATGRMYAYRQVSKSAPIWMARKILELELGNPLQADHINGDTLDNRRCNLRKATRFQNTQNARKCKTNTSGFKGVSLRKQTGRYAAYISISNNRKHLGFFTTPEEAYDAYCAAAIKHYGEFARLA